MNEFPMHRAAMKGDHERVAQLIEEGVSVDSRDDYERTPLHCAANWRQYEVAKLLIDGECDLNPKDPDGRTPLWWATIRNQRHVVVLLLQRGAQVKCTDDNEWSLLHYASRAGWTDVVRHIVQRGEENLDAALQYWYDGNTPLLLAAGHGHKDVASLLVRAGADINLSGGRKKTALHRAACNGHTSVVKLLLEKDGLNLDPQDEEGQTPLHKACMWDRREVVRQLFEAGADTNIRNNDGETVLSEYIRRRHIEFIRLFVQGGAVLQDCDYKQIFEHPFLKENILSDVGLCTQSIVNKFHRHSLPALGSISYFARKLPNIDNFKLTAGQIDEVESLVRSEIARNTFCNVVKAHPMALSALCVLSLIPWKSGAKRSASPDIGDNNPPLKKLCT